MFSGIHCNEMRSRLEEDPFKFKFFSSLTSNKLLTSGKKMQFIKETREKRWYEAVSYTHLLAYAVM